MRNGFAFLQLSANPFIGSVQLVIWLFFRPSAWRGYLQLIDPILPPHFCLAQLNDRHWQDRHLRRLLFHGYLVLPLLFFLFIICSLVFYDRLTESAITGLFIGLGIGILLGTAVSTAAGIIAAVVASSTFALTWSGTRLLFDVITAPVMGIIFGSITAAVAYVMLNIADQRHRTVLVRQIGSFVLSFLASLAVMAIIIAVTTLTIPIGERGGLGNRVLGLVFAGITGIFLGLSIGLRILNLWRG